MRLPAAVSFVVAKLISSGGVCVSDRFFVMKTCDKILTFFLSAAVFEAHVRSAAATPDDNSYKPIAARNIFKLHPPIQITVTPPPADPPPTIRLQGITTIVGQRQVLIAVRVSARAGEPAKEVFYVPDEGQREGEITVLEINEKTGSAKFDNHGTVQTLSMKDGISR